MLVNKKVFGAVVKISLISMVLTMSFQVLSVQAAALTVMSDEMTRLAASENADHVITLTLPATADFDAGGAGAGDDDVLLLGFDPTTTAFAVGAGWVAGDFLIKNATTNFLWTPWNVQVGAAADPDCTGATSENVAVAVDTTDDIFKFEACEGSGGFTATGLGHSIEITIKGASGTGTLGNPAAAGSYVLEIDMTDESSPQKNTGSMAIGIIDSDQVNIRANIDPTFTFDIDTAFSDTESAAPYVVDLGTLSKAAVVGSDHSTVKSIWIDLETNATSGAVVTVSGVYAGLASTGTAHTIPGQNTTLVAGTEAMGICISYTSGLTGVAPYQSGNCNTSTKHAVGKVNVNATNIFTAAGPVAGGRAEILVKAAISAVTPAAPDYEDTYTFIATGTF